MSIITAPSGLINGYITVNPEMASDASSPPPPQGTGRCIPRLPLGVAKDPSRRSGGGRGRFPPYLWVCFAL